MAFCVTLCATAALGQSSCPADSSAQPASPPIHSGTVGYQANSYYTAGGSTAFAVDPSAGDAGVVTLRAGTAVCLEPGFSATPSGTGTFIALTGTALSVGTSSLPNATQGTAYSTTLTPLGGTGAFHWSFTGSLPPGLTLPSTGIISGTPTTGAVGAYPISVYVSDSYAITSTGMPLTITINPVPQTITFNALSNVALGSETVSLLASASSGLPVSFASTTPTVCTVAGSTVTPVTVGGCSITASQAGNASYAAATNVVQGFTVTKASQAITFGTLPNVTYGVAPFSISATASSGLAVRFLDQRL